MRSTANKPIEHEIYLSGLWCVLIYRLADLERRTTLPRYLGPQTAGHFLYQRSGTGTYEQFALGRLAARTRFGFLCGMGGLPAHKKSIRTFPGHIQFAALVIITCAAVSGRKLHDRVHSPIAIRSPLAPV